MYETMALKILLNFDAQVAGLLKWHGNSWSTHFTEVAEMSRDER